MKIPVYQVDAFTSQPFAGNPAAVCPLQSWPAAEMLRNIALENNLSETAFFVPDGEGFHLRWFTPAVEVDLCGHATLASAFVLWEKLGFPKNTITFHTRSGALRVTRAGNLIALDFPSRPPAQCTPHPELVAALGAPPLEILAARDYLCVYESEEDVRQLSPDMGRLAQVDRFAVIVTAPGRHADFVSRFFAPAKGVPEDPVTGSAHCTLTPYWSKRLAKTKLRARQISPRGGELLCEDRGERVSIAGNAVLFLEGTLQLPDVPAAP
ncbi:MAG: PhzF family phenazine biosynthesis protein [Bryobacterales bacterium]|nr:PhzF family phenazine biosynthesis protein [Bryobacterales bacterium]